MNNYNIYLIKLLNICLEFLVIISLFIFGQHFVMQYIRKGVRTLQNGGTYATFIFLVAMSKINRVDTICTQYYLEHDSPDP